MNILRRQIIRQGIIGKAIKTSVRIPAVRPSIFNFSSQQNDKDPQDSHNDFQPKVKPIPPKRLTEEVRKEIEQILTGNKVVLFMKGVPQSPMCGYSNYAVEILKFYQIKDYFSVDILKDQQLRDELKVYSNWPTFPQLYVENKLVGGCDIMTEMHKDGSLKELFAQVK